MERGNTADSASQLHFTALTNSNTEKITKFATSKARIHSWTKATLSLTT